MKRKLLWIGDAVVASGFARATHAILKSFEADWDIFVLGLNYQGDPHDYPYKIYPCWPGGDAFGVNRTKDIVDHWKPNVVIAQQDPWNIAPYLKAVGNCPLIGAIALDGKNCKDGKAISKMAGAVLWTNFAQTELRRGGYVGPSAVIPLGVDLNIYKPYDRKAVRDRLGLSRLAGDAFIVGNVNRNQPRKRLDLTIHYFAEWTRRYNIKDAFLYLHVSPTGDVGYNVSQLMEYYGLSSRLILSQPKNLGQGASEEMLAASYSAFNIQISTTQGEGWGLTTMEGMACGVPQLFPDWSALGEWAKPAGVAVPCDAISVTPVANVIGGLPNQDAFIEALHVLYTDEAKRKELSLAGRLLVEEDRFRWSSIGAQYLGVVDRFLTPYWEVAANG